MTTAKIKTLCNKKLLNKLMMMRAVQTKFNKVVEKERGFVKKKKVMLVFASRLFGSGQTTQNHVRAKAKTCCFLNPGLLRKLNK